MNVGEAKRRRKGRKAALLTGATLLTLLVLTAWFTWDHIRFWWLFEPLGSNERGYPEYRHRKTEVVFVRLTGGEFYMGSDRREEEKPVHKVTLTPFLIAKYEVSQAGWKRLMGNNPSHFKGDALPVAVSWDECHEFCRRTGLSLPTEAQWEYACRAGTTGDYSGTGKLNEMGWFSGTKGSLRPAGEKEANQFGLHDMHGNVFEWCEDIYDPEFYKSREASHVNPLCTSGPNEYRVVRGGSWDYDANGCRSAYRYRYTPSQPQAYHVGFRPVFNLR